MEMHHPNSGWNITPKKKVPLGLVGRRRDVGCMGIPRMVYRPGFSGRGRQMDACSRTWPASRDRRLLQLPFERSLPGSHADDGRAARTIAEFLQTWDSGFSSYHSIQCGPDLSTFHRTPRLASPLTDTTNVGGCLRVSG